MIELIENKIAKNRRKKYQLLINKKLVNAKIRSFTKDEELLINVRTTDSIAAKEICKYKFQDYPNLNYISVPLNLSIAVYLSKVGITFNSSTKRYEISYRYSADSRIWKDRDNYLQFYSKYSQLIAELNYSTSAVAKHYKRINLKPEISTISQRSGFEVSFSVNDLKGSLLDEIESYSLILNEYHLDALKMIVDSELENSKLIETIFKFPLNIKVSCKQYLEYFSQFLQDLGINATSNLKEEAGKILFSVTPADDNEALDKIRKALAVYLNLPSSPIVYDDSFAAMRLQQQIENLQHSQKMAARELQFNEKLLIAQSDTIREKNITISQQQSLVDEQNKIIEKISSKAIMMNSVENKEELEEIYDGMKVGESKWLKDLTGISFNPVKAIKTAVKNTFGKDERKSVLGLDEETIKKEIE